MASPGHSEGSLHRPNPLRRAIALGMTLSVIVTSAGLAISVFGSSSLRAVATTALINMILVVALYIFSGNSGLLHFAHIGYMGIGAYAGILLTIPPAQKTVFFPDLPGFLRWTHSVEFDLFWACLAAATLTACVAFVLSFALMRLDGAQAGIASFAMLVIIQSVLVNWEQVTRGLSTVVGVPQSTTLTTAIVWTVVAIFVAAVYQESRHGLRLRASRDDLLACRALGISIARERTLAYVLSGFLLGVGGVLYAHYFTIFGPDAYYLSLTFLTVLMLVVGGIGSLTGAVAGVGFITALSELLRRIEADGLGPISFDGLPGITAFVQALVLLVVLARRPTGIVGTRELRLDVAGFRRVSARLRLSSASVVPTPAANHDRADAGDRTDSMLAGDVGDARGRPVALSGEDD